MSSKGYFLNPRWEVLWTAVGHIVFNSPAAGHITLRHPAEDVVSFVRDLEQHCLGTSEVPRPVRPATNRTKWLAIELSKADIICQHSGLIDLARRNPASWERYRSFIAYLGSLRQQPYDEAAYLRLKRASVVLVGLGGVGSLVAAMLASCDIGKLTLIDPDVVGTGNLVRQMLFSELDATLGRLKVDVISERIAEINSGVAVSTYPYALTSEVQAREVFLAQQADIVLLTADRPRILVQRLVNRACLRTRSALLNCFMDQLGPIVIPGETACFECVEKHWRDEIGPSHDDIVEALQTRDSVEYPSSILGVARAADAMAMEALLYLTGAPNLMTKHTMLRLDRGAVSAESFHRVAGCPACGIL